MLQPLEQTSRAAPSSQHHADGVLRGGPVAGSGQGSPRGVLNGARESAVRLPEQNGLLLVASCYW